MKLVQRTIIAISQMDHYVIYRIRLSNEEHGSQNWSSEHDTRADDEWQMKFFFTASSERE